MYTYGIFNTGGTSSSELTNTYLLQPPHFEFGNSINVISSANDGNVSPAELDFDDPTYEDTIQHIGSNVPVSSSSDHFTQPPVRSNYQSDNGSNKGKSRKGKNRQKLDKKKRKIVHMSRRYTASKD